MAEHKVPQDVEADDKLIGPFSFRQFVYLMVAFGAGALAFFMATKISPVLAVIPLPVIIFFGVLALPLRKDQPMETYIAALTRFYLLKSRVRIWKADGEGSLIEISNPTTDESPKTKGLEGEEVSRRLSFLANVSDTQGWSTRGLNSPLSNTNLNEEFADDAVNAPDMLEDNSVSDSLGRMLDKSEHDIRQAAIDKMNNAVNATQQPIATSSVATPQYVQHNFAYNNATATSSAQYTQPVTSPALPISTPNLQTASQLPTYDYATVAPAIQQLATNVVQPNNYEQLQPSPIPETTPYTSQQQYYPQQPQAVNSAVQPIIPPVADIVPTTTTVTNQPEPAIINDSANDKSSNDTSLIGSDGGVIDIKLH